MVSNRRISINTSIFDRSNQVHLGYAKEAYIAVTSPTWHPYHHYYSIDAACITRPRSAYTFTLPNLEIKAKLKLECEDER